MREDIIRMCPGCKDYANVKTKRGKDHRQKRLLLYNISEVGESFKKESSFTVVLSTFASRRPPNILRITPYDQEVCVCKYDASIRLLLDGLNKVLPSVPTKPEDSSTCVFYEPVEIGEVLRGSTRKWPC